MSDADMASTFSELERKLKALEAELRAPDRAPDPGRRDAPVPAPPSGTASTVRPTADPAPTFRPTAAAEALTPRRPPAAVTGAPAGDVQSQLDELLRFRQELEHSAQELMGEYERVLGNLRADSPSRS